MALTLEAIKAKSKPNRPRCTFGVLLEHLDDHDAGVLAEAMADVGITNVAISDVLIAEGHDIRPTTVSRHRNGRCNCDG